MKPNHQFIIDVKSLDKNIYSVDTIMENQWLSDILNKCEYPVSPVSGHCAFTATKTNSAVKIAGNITVQVKTECAICLSPINLDIQIDLDYNFKQKTDSEQKKDEFTPDELKDEYFTGNKINISDLVEDEILLELPIIPRCTGSCSKLEHLITADEQKQPNESGLQAIASPELSKEN